MEKEKIDPTTITMDVPLFIRMLEYAREDANSDMDLHKVTEKINSLGNKKLTMDDYEKIINIKKSEKKMNESITLATKISKLKKVISKVILEDLNDSSFYNKLKFEINKGDSDYESKYNKTLGEYGVDSPDQLSEDEQEKFYGSLDKKLKGDVKPVNERFNTKVFTKLLKEGKIQKGKIFKEHGVFLTFQELAIMEVAPPGREDQVKKLKTKFPKDVAYKIAWSQANKNGKPKNENNKTALMPPDFETEKEIKEDSTLTPQNVANDKQPTKLASPVKQTESEEIVEPDKKGKKIIKEKDKKMNSDEMADKRDKSKKDEVAFSSGLNGDRYDKQPNGDRTTNAIPGQQGYSQEVPNKNLKKSKS